jgi:hypothetical protein
VANRFLLNNFGIKSLEAFAKEIGTPYRWCQILCGLFYETRQDRLHMIYPSYQKGGQKNDDDTVEMEEEANENDNEDNNDKEREMSEQAKKEKEHESSDQNVLNQQHSRLSETKLFERILNRLKSRFKARITLQEAINQLS